MSDKNFMAYGDAETILTEFADSIKSKEPIAFTGTQAEWNALTTAEKSKYTKVCFTDDATSGGAVVVDEVTSGNFNAVSSNAVAKKFQHKLETSTPSLTKEIEDNSVYLFYTQGGGDYEYNYAWLVTKSGSYVRTISLIRGTNTTVSITETSNPVTVSCSSTTLWMGYVRLA